MIPAGTAGSVTLAFESNALYRGGLAGGLALLPLLLLLALVPVRRPLLPDEPARPWRPGPVATGLGVLAVGAVISGVAGVVVVGAALGVRYLLRRAPEAVRRGHGRDRGGRADTGRRGVVAKPMAIGRRVRRPLGGRSAAGADLGGRAGGVGGHDSGRSADTRCFADDFGPPCRDRAAGLRSAMKIAGKALPKRLNRLRRRRARCGAPDLDAAGAGRLHGDHVVDDESHPGIADDVAPLLVSAECVPDMSIVEPSGPRCTPTGLICGSPAGPMVQNRPIGWSRRYANSAAVKVMVSPFGPGFSETQSQVRVDS